MEPLLASIIMFGGNFAPRGWAFCSGQLLPIASYSAVFSLLGTTYGGDGRTTFGLPDLRGRVPIHPGNGPGLQSYRLGQKGGVENVTLTESQIPAHSHTGELSVSSSNGGESNPTGNYLAAHAGAFNEDPNPNQNLQGVVGSNTGGSQPHTNMQPYQCVNFIIALQGVFPSRS